MSPLGRLPASFEGLLPAASGTVRWQLDLLPGGRFQLRQTFVDRPEPNRFDDIGGYALEGRRLTLQGGREAPVHLALQDDGSLRALDTEGRPIESTAPHTLRRLAEPALIEPRLSLSGWFTYLADAPRIVLCADGRSLPVQMAGDYLALERAYGASGVAPGAPLWVQLQAQIALRPSMEESLPPEPTLVVERFGRADPQGRCAGARADRRLTGTDWRLVWLDGRRIEPPADPRRAPALRLNAGRVTGSDGCNRVMGPVAVDGSRLQIGPLVATRMACADGMDLAQAFTDALARVQGHAIRGEMLELLDAQGATVLRFQAQR
jgi:heat shock protein HslJ